jgi:hypothetical protein
MAKTFKTFILENKARLDEISPASYIHWHNATLDADERGDEKRAAYAHKRMTAAYNRPHPNSFAGKAKKVVDKGRAVVRLARKKKV